MSLVASTSKQVGNFAALTTDAIDTTSGKLIVAWMSVYDGETTLALSDSKGNTWQKLTERVGSGIDPYLGCLFYCINPTVGTGHTFTGTGQTNGTLIVGVFDDVVSGFDAQSGFAHTGSDISSIQPGAITPGQPGNLFVTAVANQTGTGVSVDSGFTEAADVLSSVGQGGALAYKVRTGSTAAESPTWTIPSQGSNRGVYSAMAAFTLAVPDITTTSLPGGTVGVAYSETLAVTGGTGSITWSVETGSLPAGLSLNASSGAITGTPTTAGTSNFTVRATDSASAYDEQALSITIVDPPPVPTNKWSRMGIVPTGCLEQWLMYGTGSLGHYIEDHSGNGRHMTGNAGNAPVIQSNLLNGHPGWYFNGSRDPLSSNEDFSVRHLFVVASFEKSAFTQYEGLYGWKNASGGPDLLVSDTSGDEMFDFSINYAGGVDYRKNDVAFAIATADAPMSGAHSIMEMIVDPAASLDGVQIGQQQNLTARKFNGWFFESLAFSCELTEGQRFLIYNYLAMKYWLWPKVASGLNVFPFAADKTSSLTRERENYISEPYEGDPKALVRGEFERDLGLQFTLRRQEEFDAAEVFHEQHYPLSHFIFRDYRFYPARDREVKFTGPIKEQGSDVTFRFNYGFEVGEAM